MSKILAALIASVCMMNASFAQYPVAASKPQAPAPTVSSPVVAPSVCEAKAVSKMGKALSGAAKTASIKKCEADAKAVPIVVSLPPAVAATVKPTVAVTPAQTPTAACETKAVSKDGKSLSGAAKNASVKKCVADSATAK